MRTVLSVNVCRVEDAFMFKSQLCIVLLQLFFLSVSYTTNASKLPMCFLG